MGVLYVGAVLRISMSLIRASMSASESELDVLAIMVWFLSGRSRWASRSAKTVALTGFLMCMCWSGGLYRLSCPARAKWGGSFRR